MRKFILSLVTSELSKTTDKIRADNNNYKQFVPDILWSRKLCLYKFSDNVMESKSFFMSKTFSLQKIIVKCNEFFSDIMVKMDSLYGFNIHNNCTIITNYVFCVNICA